MTGRASFQTSILGDKSLYIFSVQWQKRFTKKTKKERKEKERNCKMGGGDTEQNIHKLKLKLNQSYHWNKSLESKISFSVFLCQPVILLHGNSYNVVL